MVTISIRIWLRVFIRWRSGPTVFSAEQYLKSTKQIIYPSITGYALMLLTQPTALSKKPSGKSIRSGRCIPTKKTSDCSAGGLPVESYTAVNKHRSTCRSGQKRTAGAGVRLLQRVVQRQVGELYTFGMEDTDQAEAVADKQDHRNQIAAHLMDIVLYQRSCTHNKQGHAAYD